MRIFGFEHGMGEKEEGRRERGEGYIFLLRWRVGCNGKQSTSLPVEKGFVLKAFCLTPHGGRPRTMK